MTLASSGEISIGGSTANRSINLELGRSATATSSLGESALRTLAGVSSGAISLSSFYGKSNVTLAAALNNYNAGAYNVVLERSRYVGSGFVEAEVGVTLYSDGTARYYYQDSGTATTNFTSFTWRTGSGGSGDYYARFIVDSGSASPNNSSSATATDLVLSTTREWRCYSAANTNYDDFYVVNGTLEIRTAGGTVLASKTIEMSTYVASGTPP